MATLSKIRINEPPFEGNYEELVLDSHCLNGVINYDDDDDDDDAAGDERMSCSSDGVLHLDFVGHEAGVRIGIEEGRGA
jgi:hypothetical protein